jgi:hypothetical protein
MAREAGFECFGRNFACTVEDLERFASIHEAQVRADAMERAAVIVETCKRPGWAESCDVREWLAEAIRSAKQSEESPKAPATDAVCGHCNKTAPGWSEKDLRTGSRYTSIGKEYHCREAAIDD